MTGKPVRNREDEQFLSDVRARQSNTVWPDPLENGRKVDAFVWKGSRNATRMQRVGIATFGLIFLLTGLGFASMAYSRSNLVAAVFAVLAILLGLRFFRNTFLR